MYFWDLSIPSRRDVALLSDNRKRPEKGQNEYDKNDDLNCAGYIPYQPFLTEAHQNTPLLAIENKGNLVERFSLNQNYPNPFNPTTTISYSIDKDSYVTISIFDISGKLITTVQNEYQTQGLHSISWNGSDYLGNKLGAGLYFYQVKSGDFSQTRKMVLLK